MSAKRRSAAPDTRGGGQVTPARIALAVCVVLALVFILENTRKTTIRVIGPEVTMPLWLALLVMALLGAAVGYLGARYTVRRR